MFRIFIDEVGNHDLKSSDDPNHRYLSLTGVIMRLDYELEGFTTALNAVKQDIFGTTNIILHRRDILTAKPPFEALNNEATRAHFDELVLKLMGTASYRAFTVVIDKHEHQHKYAVWRFHPYHYCLTVTLERYVQFLSKFHQPGDVMVESRGKKENMQLEKAYKHIYQNGSDHVPSTLFQQHLTSRELKIRQKAANIAGLQLADLIANPSCRDLICEKTGAQMMAEFGKEVVEVLKKKRYLRSPTGKIPGWGTKWLP
jgi:Protein of unknown function (DUF3800)